MNKIPKRATVAELEKIMAEQAPPGIKQAMIYRHIRVAGLVVDEKHKVSVQEFLTAYIKSKATDNKNTDKEVNINENPKKYKAYLECVILQMELEEKKRQKEAIEINEAEINTKLQQLTDSNLGEKEKKKLLEEIVFKIAINPNLPITNRLSAIKELSRNRSINSLSDDLEELSDEQLRTIIKEGDGVTEEGGAGTTEPTPST